MANYLRGSCVVLCALSTLAAASDSTAIALWGSSRSAETERAYALMNEGQTSRAREAFEAALKKDPRDSAALDGLATMMGAFSDHQRALELRCQAIRSAGTSPMAELAIEDCATVLAGCSNPDLFTSLLKEPASLSPVNLDVLRACTVEWMLQRGQYKEALSTAAPLTYANSWMLIGVFDNRDKSGFDRVYDPEKEIDFDRQSDGRNRRVHWFPLDASACEGKIVLSEMFEPHLHAIAYACTFAHCEEPCHAVLRAGCAGALKVFVNGKLAGAVPQYHDFGRDKLAVPVSLRKGWNQILVKSAVVEETQWAFSLRLCALQGGALKGVAFQNSAAALAEYKKDNTPPPSYPLARVYSSEEEAVRARPQLGLLPRLQQKAAANPDDAYVLSLLGALMDARKLGEKNSSSTDLTSAASLAKRAAALQPANPFLKLSFAAITDDSNEARAAAEAVLKTNPELPGVYEQLAALAHDSHTHIVAEDYARNAWRSFHDAHPLYAGLVLIDELSGIDRPLMGGTSEGSSSGKNERAEAWLIAKELTEARPFLADAWIRRLALEASMSARRQATETALKFCGGNTPLRQSRIQDLVRLERETEAAHFAAEPLEALPFSVNDVLTVAREDRRAGLPGEELKVLETARHWAPENPELLGALALAKHRGGKPEEARALFHAILDIKPNSPTIKDYLALLEAKSHGIDRQYFAAYDIALKELPLVDAAKYPKDNVVRLLNQEVVRVNANGSASRMVHLVAKVLRTAGIREMRDHYIWYEPQRQAVDILRAAVITPDGRELARASISDRATSAGMGVETLIYDEHHYKHVIFSDLEAGSVIDLQYTIRDFGENIFGDYFADSFRFSPDGRPVVRAQYVLDIPKTIDVQTQSLNTKLAPERLDSHDPEREISKWELKDIPSVEREFLMPPIVDSLPSLQVTTMHSWKEVGAWFWTLAHEQVTVNEEMRKEIAVLVKDCKTDTEKVRAIHDWVIRKIRYLGIEFGRNGYKPHRATETYKALYGDCKDTATLVTAMLKSIGIDSRLVLIRTNNAGAVPADSLPLPNLFNHCIAYVPHVDGKDYWIDGTTDFYRLGEVPAADCGTQVLVAGPDGGEFMKIPESSSIANSIEQLYDVSVDPAGAAKLKLHDTRSGYFAPLLRESIETPGRFEASMRDYAAQHFNGAQLTAIKSSEALSQGPAWSEMELNVPGLASHGGEQWMLPSTFETLSLSHRYGNELSRVHDIVMHVPWSRKTEIRYRVDGLAVANLPEEAELKEPFGSFGRTVQRHGNEVTIRETLEFPLARIAVKDYQAFRGFCQRVDTLMDQKVVLKSGR